MNPIIHQPAIGTHGRISSQQLRRRTIPDVQTAVGLACVVLGCIHFVDRGRTPHARSFYFGSVSQSHALRAALALIEVSCGFALLFTA